MNSQNISNAIFFIIYESTKCQGGKCKGKKNVVDKNWCSYKDCIIIFNAVVPEIPNANIIMNCLNKI